MKTSLVINYLRFIFLLLIFLQPFSACANPGNNFKTGADLIVENPAMLIGNNIALVVNHTSKLSNGIHLADTLFNLKEITIKKLFSPEHGIRGDADAGKHI